MSHNGKNGGLLYLVVFVKDRMGFRGKRKGFSEKRRAVTKAEFGQKQSGTNQGECGQMRHFGGWYSGVEKQGIRVF